ncbi:MAG: hypothetical protein JNL90_10775 [Planctomycetes bacterium]|nr:hypothetical protein [Planctomycetota bacterium]
MAVFSGEGDLAAVVRACAAVIARPLDPPALVAALLDGGEFDAAAFLLMDDGFRALAAGPELSRLEDQVARARDAGIADVRGRLASVSERAARYEIKVGEDEILKLASQRLRSALERLDEVDRQASAAERRAAESLEACLAAIDCPAGFAEPAFDAWRESVRHAIRLGALEAASAAVADGPSADRPPPVDIPAPPIWSYRKEPVARVLGWFFGEGVTPPGFERYRPDRSDAGAWAFLHALVEVERSGPDSIRREALLAGIAGALGCKLLGAESSALGTLGRFDDLSEPALHALARHRWPDGVPLWLPAHSGAECPVVQDDLLLEFGIAVHPRTDRILALDRDDVLATLHDRPGRRRRILAQIGRQIPLERAFDKWTSDESVVWGRDDHPSGLAGAGAAFLLTGAPGMGKSTLLKELARAAGGVDVVTAGSRELPASDHVFVDGADRLDAPELLRLVKDAHWLRTTRTPTPSITIAVRPETRLAIERAAPGMFSTYELPPRALASLREQARVMLGWVGIEAEAAGSYDRLAFLGSGNPTVLFHLCRALTMVLSRAARPHRRFSPVDVDQSWRDETLVSTLRRMFWEPVQAYDGAAGVLRTVYDFGGSGPLDPELLAWAVRESLGDREAVWVDERIRLLGGYGLVRSTPEGVRPASGGIGILVRGWVAMATDEADSGRPEGGL